MALPFPSSPSPFPPFTSPPLHSLPPLTLRYITCPVNSRRYYRRLSSPSLSPSPALDSKSDGSPSAPRRFPKFPRPRRRDTDADGAADRHHPAFRPIGRQQFRPDAEDPIRLTEKGVTYNLKDAPFEFQYSYTETPKIKPVALREPPFLPFGPKETPRPWTGRAPLPSSKKKLPEFDSFKLPPPGKKGVKPVQKPGPFLAGSGGPRYSMTREEILGDPLTKEEVEDLIKGCLKTRRQLNMGRDGFTHNMLENIHSHWKRRRVCKIRCLGVCTVDLDNVCQQLEEKTGGKVIHRQGGVIFLFRGRNYNYKTRPRYPLMLWRPVSPVYPRLVKRVPDGLTLEEAKTLRKKGREVPPICKLGKNGVYVNLVNQVREAFEVCELVRVNCKGMNKSDFKKIGAKLQDLVPCMLLSFEFEHILMWRGREWKSSLIESNGNGQVMSSSVDNSLLVNKEHRSYAGSDAISNNVDEVVAANMPVERPAELAEVAENFSEPQSYSCSDAISSMSGEVVTTNMRMESSTESVEDAQSFSELKPDTCSDSMSNMADEAVNAHIPIKNADGSADDARSFSAVGAGNESPSAKIEVEPNTEESKCLETKMEHLEGVRLLLEQAIENGIATSLSELEYPDADIVYQRSVEFAKTARPGPTFQVRTRKKEILTAVNNEKNAMLESFEDEERENTLVPVIPAKKVGDIKKSGGDRRKHKKDRLLEVIPKVVPHGSLRVDELAKLLS